MACQALFLAVMAGIGYWHRLSVYYYLGLAVAGALAIYQYRLIRERDRERCFKAFLSNNWVGMAVFAGLFIDMMLADRIYYGIAR